MWLRRIIRILMLALLGALPSYAQPTPVGNAQGYPWLTGNDPITFFWQPSGGVPLTLPFYQYRLVTPSGFVPPQGGTNISTPGTGCNEGGGTPGCNAVFNNVCYCQLALNNCSFQPVGTQLQLRHCTDATYSTCNEWTATQSPMICTSPKGGAKLTNANPGDTVNANDYTTYFLPAYQNHAVSNPAGQFIVDTPIP